MGVFALAFGEADAGGAEGIAEAARAGDAMTRFAEEEALDGVADEDGEAEEDADDHGAGAEADGQVPAPQSRAAALVLRFVVERRLTPTMKLLFAH